VVLLDTDHLCGICGDPSFGWRGLTRGTNPIYMDRYTAGVTTRGSDTNYNPNNATDQGIRRNLGYARQFAERVDLAAMTPRGDLASTGYALAKPVAIGAQYLAYLPTGGSVTVNLSATTRTLSVEWFSPTTAQTTVGAAVAGGASRGFNAPFVGEAVLYIFDPSVGGPAAPPTEIRIIR
jgi:hypothetical protein